MQKPRISFLTLTLTVLLLFSQASMAADQVIDSARAEIDPESIIAWYDSQLLELEGQGWSETMSDYDRLPAKANGVVRSAVWNLSRHSAGMAVRFKTNATSISVDWTLTKKNLAMSHMSATGVSGVDLYVRHEGQWRWLKEGQPKAQNNKKTIVKSLSPETREYLLYLPLYNGVSSVKIGIPSAYEMIKPAPRESKPLFFWGTSITHGACASRPGMIHPSMLGRRFDREVINLGFSGNGKMEQEVTDIVKELDPAVFIIDCLPNMVASEITARTAPLVRTLRAAHPQTPILLVEDRNYSNTFLNSSLKKRNETSQAALKAEYQKLINEGVTNLHYLKGDDLLGHDGDGTVDNSHPNDLGFFRQANEFERVLKPILAQ